MSMIDASAHAAACPCLEVGGAETNPVHVPGFSLLPLLRNEDL
jgi:hypothetical protein